jgi:PPE-repeat protein
MDFSVSPPEINSLPMFVGAGSAPMLEAAAAPSGLAEVLDAAARSFSAVTSALTAQAWQGPPAQAMAAMAAPYASWLNAAAARAQSAAAQAGAVASGI